MKLFQNLQEQNFLHLNYLRTYLYHQEKDWTLLSCFASFPLLKMGQILSNGPPGWKLCRVDNPPRKSICYGANERTLKLNWLYNNGWKTDKRFAYFLMKCALHVQNRNRLVASWYLIPIYGRCPNATRAPQDRDRFLGEKPLHHISELSPSKPCARSNTFGNISKRLCTLRLQFWNVSLITFTSL